MPGIATRYCRQLGRFDGEAFGLEELRREHAEIGFGHRDRERLVGVWPEDDRFANRIDRGAVDLLAFELAVEHLAVFPADMELLSIGDYITC